MDDPRSGNPVQIGWLNVPAHEYTNASYECAAWSSTMQVPEQRVPLMFDGYWLLASASATVTQDYFQSLYCGQRIGEVYDRKQNAGKATARHYQMNEYAIESLLASGEAELLPEWTLHRSTFWHQWGVQCYRRWHARIVRTFALPCFA